MISLYEGNGYTKYVLRSGLELTLHEDDFTDMLGFKDEMAQVKVRCNELDKAYQESYAKNVVLNDEIKKLKGRLLWAS